MSVTGANRSTKSGGELALSPPAQHLSSSRFGCDGCLFAAPRRLLPSLSVEPAAAIRPTARQLQPWAEPAVAIRRASARSAPSWAEQAAAIRRVTRTWVGQGVVNHPARPIWAERAAAIRPE